MKISYQVPAERFQVANMYRTKPTIWENKPNVISCTDSLKSFITTTGNSEKNTVLHYTGSREVFWEQTVTAPWCFIAQVLGFVPSGSWISHVLLKDGQDITLSKELQSGYTAFQRAWNCGYDYSDEKTSERLRAITFTHRECEIDWLLGRLKKPSKFRPAKIHRRFWLSQLPQVRMKFLKELIAMDTSDSAIYIQLIEQALKSKTPGTHAKLPVMGLEYNRMKSAMSTEEIQEIQWWLDAAQGVARNPYNGYIRSKS